MDGLLDPDDLVITRVLRSAYPGRCRCCDGYLKPNSKIGKIERADNPHLPVGGAVCERCSRGIPRKVGS